MTTISYSDFKYTTAFYPAFNLISDPHLTVMDKIKKRVPRRGIWRWIRVTVPDPSFYKHGNTVIAHPATHDDLRRAIASDAERKLSEMARAALVG